MSIQEMLKKEDVEDRSELCFQSTSVAKVIILSLITFGVYHMILSFNYWKTLKERFGYKVSPFWRCVFAGFTNFWLFPIFSKYFEEYNRKLAGAGAIAAVYLICNWMNNKISMKTAFIDNTVWSLEIMSFILCLITTGVFVCIQSRINKINEEHYQNAPVNRWKVSNTVWAIVCVLIIILAYMPV